MLICEITDKFGSFSNMFASFLDFVSWNYQALQFAYFTCSQLKLSTSFKTCNIFLRVSKNQMAKILFSRTHILEPSASSAHNSRHVKNRRTHWNISFFLSFFLSFYLSLSFSLSLSLSFFLSSFLNSTKCDHVRIETYLGKKRLERRAEDSIENKREAE